MLKLSHAFRTLSRRVVPLIALPQFFLHYGFCSTNSKLEDQIETLLAGVGESSELPNEEPYMSKDRDQQLKDLQRSVSQYYSLGRFKDAKETSMEYVKEIKDVYGCNHPATLSGLNNLALVFKTAGNYELAKLIYGKILSAYIELFGVKQNSVIVVMQNLANLHRQLNEHDSALQLYADVLALRRGQLRKEIASEDRVSIAVCEYQMAGSYREMQQYKKSEEMLEESLKLLLETVGEEHLHTAACLNNMGLTYKKQKKFEKAEQFYLRCLRVRESLLSSHHPDLIAIKHNLGELYIVMNKDKEAAEYLTEAMEAIKTSEDSSK